MSKLEWNDFNHDEQERLKAISAMRGAVKKLKELAPKVTDDETFFHPLNSEIDCVEMTLSNIEGYMDIIVKNRKINLFA